MRKVNFSKVSKAKEICIKCKCRVVLGSGEARKFNWCPTCYEKICSFKRRGAKKNSMPYESPVPKEQALPVPRLKEDSRHWEMMRIRLKARFRHIVIMALGNKCLKCGRSSHSLPIEADHVFPVSKYPHREFDLTNMQTLCHECNSVKSNKNCRDYRSEDEKRIMQKIESGLCPNDQILRVKRLMRDISKFRKLTKREQVTGHVGKSS